MRRALLAVTLGGVLLNGAACDRGAEPAVDAAPSVPGPEAVAPSAPPDYSADTRQVCGRLERIFDDDIEAFGSEIGKMITYKEAELSDRAEAAEKAAGKRLRTVAGYCA